MKKGLIALAVMSAFAGSAMAQSSVQIYGTVDAGIENVKSGGVSTTTLGSGLQSASSIGFKGTEDLGGGLKANFLLEQGFSVDTGDAADATKSFNRQAYVGVGSNMGEVRLGLQHSPMRAAVMSIDPFGKGLAGNAIKVLGAGTYSERTNNAVSYTSPTFNGLTGTVQYGLGETAGSTTNNSTLNLGASYVNGPVNVQFAYADRKFNTGVDEQQKDWLLGGTYDFGIAKAHVGFGETKYEDKVASTTDKTRSYLVGASVPMGKHTLLASYVVNDVRTLDNAKTGQWALGYTYDFSKRTNLYASYGHVSNDDNVGLVGAAALGESVSKMNVGVRHTF